MNMTTAKLRIDLSQGLIDVEGSEGFILQLYADFKERLALPGHIAIAAPQPTQTNERPVEKASALPPPTEKASPVSAKPKSKRIAKDEPKFLSDYDLINSTLGKLKDFHSQYNAKTNYQNNLIFIYYLTDGKNLEEITVDHLLTCYRNVGIKIPKALRQSVLDTQNRHGWIASEATGIRLTTAGRNHIEHDMHKHVEPE